MKFQGKGVLPGCFLAAMLFHSSLCVGPAGAGAEKAAQDPQAAPEQAATPKNISEIVVSADRIITPTRQARETVYTGSEITAKGMEIQGPRAATSVSNALNLLPGINVESADSNGLAAEMSNVRVRGIRGNLGALTVEGVPNYGGNPIGPRDYLYDLENMQGLSVYKGAVPGDIGTGIGSRGGAINLKPDWPHQETGLLFKQVLGSNDYTRTFARFDSGAIPEVSTRISGSYSYTDAEKWRGPGDLGPRKNANIAVDQSLGQRLNAKLWVNHNDLDQHLYRALSYAEIQNLSANYSKDFNPTRTGIAGKDKDFYDYNRGSYQNDDQLAILTLRATDSLNFSLKPYHSKEDTEILQGVTTNGGMVQKRLRDIDRTGIIGEGTLDLSGIKTTLGHHYESSDMDISTENYAITGSTLSYRGMGVMGTSGTTYLNSPYLKLAGGHGPFDWQAGLKYFLFEDAASDGFITGPGPAYAPVRATDLDREARDYDIWLPTVAAGYHINEELQAHTSYGRTFIRPYSYLPLVSLYNANRPAFQKAGVNLQQMFEGYGIEQSDTVDLGMRFTSGLFDIDSTIYYGKHKDLLTTIYDPRVRLNYQQNIGEATGYGLDVEINTTLTDTLTIFVNPSWTTMTYDGDLSYAGAQLDTDGNQVVDTPQWLVKTGLIYHPGNLEVIPMVRFQGKRYSDAENRGEVGSNAIADLRLTYTLNGIMKSKALKIALDLTNLFDKEYVSVINASDDTRDGLATFYQGAPFAAMLSAVVEF
jgi:iron complex outermembrane recepter protein